jgi:uncharacterized protein
MYPIQEIVLKIATRCNLNCTYCYEYNLGDVSFKNQSKFFNSQLISSLAKRINEHCEEFALNEFTIGIHGGEPLLMAPIEIENLLESLMKGLNPKLRINFAIQTNGILLDKFYIEIFKKYNVKISISLDGVKSSHDKNRIDFSGKPTYEKVVKAIDLLKVEANELFVGILCVIDIFSDPIETFDSLAKFGVDIDFLLPLNHWDNLPTYPPKIKNAYGKWYFKIYDEWVNKKRNNHIDVRFLKNIIVQLLGGSAIYEVMTVNPIGLLTINTDGFIEGVDTIKSTASGAQITNLNITDTSFTQALNHDVVKSRQGGIENLSDKCKNCKFLIGCSGGYFPNRYSAKNGFDNPSVYCDDLYWLLDKIQIDLETKISNE